MVFRFQSYGGGGKWNFNLMIFLPTDFFFFLNLPRQPLAIPGYIETEKQQEFPDILDTF